MDFQQLAGKALQGILPEREELRDRGERGDPGEPAHELTGRRVRGKPIPCVFTIVAERTSELARAHSRRAEVKRGPDALESQDVRHTRGSRAFPHSRRRPHRVRSRRGEIPPLGGHRARRSITAIVHYAVQ